MPSTMADRFEPLPANRAAIWANFLQGDTVFFPNLVGLVVEEIRLDYARLSLPFRPELHQAAGAVHGGATATLIDTVVVPAVASAYDAPPVMFTVNMTVQYLSAVIDEDMVAEGWITKRGRSTVFCRAEVRTASDVVAATGELVYQVRPAR